MMDVVKYYELVDKWAPHDKQEVYKLLIQADYDPGVPYDAWRGLVIYAEKKCHCKFK